MEGAQIMTFKKTKHMSHCKSANTFFMRRSNFVGTQFRQKAQHWSYTEMALLQMPFWVFLHFLFLFVSILKKGQCEEPSWPRQLIYLIHRSSGKNMQLEHWSYWGGYSRYKTYTIPSTFLTLIMGKNQGLLDGLITTLTSMSSIVLSESSLIRYPLLIFDRTTVTSIDVVVDNTCSV